MDKKLLDVVNRVSDNYLKQYIQKLPVVKVGVLEGAQNTATGEPIAPYAIVNEYGGAGITPRPFMRRAFDKCKQEWTKSVSSALKAHFTVEDAFRRTGEMMVTDIKRSIDGELGAWPPNNPSWQAQKTTVSVYKGKRIKATNNKPLIWTQSMYDSISYKLSDDEE